MIPKIEVVFNLTNLEALFDNAIKSPTTYPEANYFAKLAILECSAWLEECIESIYETLAISNLTVRENIKAYESNLKSNHGFNYEKYFRNKLLVHLIGLVNVEKLELAIGSSPKFHEMNGAINTLTALRGGLAHSHLTGTTTLTVQPVKETIRLFNQSISGLIEIEKQLQKLKFK